MFRRLTESLRRISGVTVLSVRASLRTKVVAALLALLVVCVLALPGAVKGDGTPAGELHILLTYTLGFAFGILCLSTLWAACALFAAEIDSARMQLSAVKPVSAAELWLGKWLALLAMNAVLLLTAYAGVYAQIRWRMHQRNWDAMERPVSRYVARPLLPTPREEARQMYARMASQKAVPKGVSEKTVLRVLEEQAREKYDIINPGEQVKWRFELQRPVMGAERITVRVKFDTEFSTRTHVTGLCRLRCMDRPAPPVEVPLDDFTLNEIEFSVDTRAFGVGRDRGIQNFELSFSHTGDPKRASALMLRFRQDVALLTPGGTFEANLLRSAFVHWGVLALLGAFGLTLSACFSLPVAAFAATVLLALAMVGNSVMQVVSEEDEKEWKNRAGIFISRGVTEVTRHAMQIEPLTALTRGERLDFNVLGASARWNVLWIPMLLAGAGCWVLRRRELADID